MGRPTYSPVGSSLALSSSLTSAAASAGSAARENAAPSRIASSGLLGVLDRPVGRTRMAICTSLTRGLSSSVWIGAGSTTAAPVGVYLAFGGATVCVSAYERYVK